MAAPDLTTLAAVRAWLAIGAQPMPPTDDALLAGLITAVSQFIQTWLGRQLALQDWTEMRDGSGGARMSFGAFPVTAVAGLSIDGQLVPPAPPLGAQGWTAGYVFTPTEIAVRGYRFTRGIQNVVMTYTAGYAVIPPDIVQATTQLVAQRYRERTRIGESSRHLGSETVTYSTADMPADVATLLWRYRLVVPVQGVLVPAMTQTDPGLLVAAA
jgi:hypothetical protein